MDEPQWQVSDAPSTCTGDIHDFASHAQNPYTHLSLPVPAKLSSIGDQLSQKVGLLERSSSNFRMGMPKHQPRINRIIKLPKTPTTADSLLAWPTFRPSGIDCIVYKLLLYMI